MPACCGEGRTKKRGGGDKTRDVVDAAEEKEKEKEQS